MLPNMQVSHIPLFGTRAERPCCYCKEIYRARRGSKKSSRCILDKNDSFFTKKSQEV